MKTGYDQFFKQARKAKSPSALPLTAKNKKNPNPIQKSAPKKQQSKSSATLLSVIFFGIFVTGGGYLYLEEIEKFLGKVELSLGVAASANEGTEPTETQKTEGSVSPSGAAAPVAVQTPEAPVPEFVEKLSDRKKELDLKEEELKRLESEIETQKVEIEKRLQELQKTREEISKTLESRVQLDSQRVDALVQVYSTMKPQQAAKIMETLDQQLVVEILGKMKKKNAAEVMNVMKPEKVQAFSEQFAGYRTPSSTKAEAAPAAAP